MAVPFSEYQKNVGGGSQPSTQPTQPTQGGVVSFSQYAGLPPKTEQAQPGQSFITPKSPTNNPYSGLGLAGTITDFSVGAGVGLVQDVIGAARTVNKYNPFTAPIRGIVKATTGKDITEPTDKFLGGLSEGLGKQFAGTMETGAGTAGLMTEKLAPYLVSGGSKSVLDAIKNGGSLLSKLTKIAPTAAIDTLIGTSQAQGDVKVGLASGVSSLAGYGMIPKTGGFIARTVRGGTVPGYVSDVAFNVAEQGIVPSSFAPGVNTVIGTGIGGGVAALDRKTAAANRVVRVQEKRAKELSRFETDYPAVREAAENAEKAGIDARKVLAETDYLHNAVDTNGRVNTKQPGGAADKFYNENIYGYESGVGDELRASGETVGFTEVRNKIAQTLTSDSGTMGILSREQIQQKADDVASALRPSPDGTIPLINVHEAKITRANPLNYGADTQATNKAIVRALKELVEDNAKTINVKEYNKRLSGYYRVLDMIEALDGKRVEGGRLGKHFASTIGAIAGSHFGAIGPIVGSELARYGQGIRMSSKLRGKTGKTVDQVMGYEPIESLRQSSKSVGNRNTNQRATMTAVSTPIYPPTVLPKVAPRKPVVPQQRKLLPAPSKAIPMGGVDAQGRRIDAQGNLIVPPQPKNPARVVPAKKMSYKDKKSGRYKRGWTSEGEGGFAMGGVVGRFTIGSQAGWYKDDDGKWKYDPKRGAAGAAVLIGHGLYKGRMGSDTVVHLPQIGEGYYAKIPNRYVKLLENETGNMKWLGRGNPEKAKLNPHLSKVERVKGKQKEISFNKAMKLSPPLRKIIDRLDKKMRSGGFASISDDFYRGEGKQVRGIPAGLENVGINGKKHKATVNVLGDDATYLAFDEKTASKYGSVSKVAAKLDNPLVLDNTKGYDGDIGLYDFLKKAGIKSPLDESIQAEGPQAVKDATEKFAQAIRDAGYDGVVVKVGREGSLLQKLFEDDQVVLLSSGKKKVNSSDPKNHATPEEFVSKNTTTDVGSELKINDKNSVALYHSGDNANYDTIGKHKGFVYTENTPNAPLIGAKKNSLFLVPKDKHLSSEEYAALRKIKTEEEILKEYWAIERGGMKGTVLYKPDLSREYTRSQLTDIWKNANEKPLGKLTPTENLSDAKEYLRKAKGLSASDIMAKYPDINLKKDVTVTDIHGNKKVIPEGEALTPYELKGNKVLLQDGVTYIVSKNQFQNVKGQSIVGEAKEFAPELKGTEETVLGASKNEKALKALDERAMIEYNKPYNALKEDDKLFVRQMVADKIGAGAVEDALVGTQATKFSQWTLPGGENYKEILVKAPQKQRSIEDAAKLDYETFIRKGGEPSWGELPSHERENYIRLAGEMGKDYMRNVPDFKSSHWDEPNVLSHIRMNERTYNGKKVAFMEELQSDWAREGRAKGFATEITKDTAKEQGFTVYKSKTNMGDEAYFIDNQSDPYMYRKGFPNHGFDTEAQAWNALVDKLKTSSTAIPNHPLLKNWQELSVKRALKEAVDSDAEYFAWINGEQTSARYNLATYVDSVFWTHHKESGRVLNITPKGADSRTGGLRLWADKDGIITDVENARGATANASTWKGKKLDEVLGKGLADSIMSKESGTLSGEGLKFGGEWANNLYDKQVSDIVREETGGKIIDMDMGLPVEKGDTFKWFFTEKSNPGQAINLSPENMKVGMKIGRGNDRQGIDDYIITEILGDGKFKAVQKSDVDRAIHDGLRGQDAIDYVAEKGVQTFDISQKTTTQQGILLTPEIKARIRGEAPPMKKPSGKSPLGQAYGAVAGVETDDEGNVRFNPEKAALGLLGAGVASRKGPQVYKGAKNLTLKTLEKLKGRSTVSKQFISDLTNAGDIKQAERDTIRRLLADQGDTVNVKEFADRVETELLPLTRTPNTVRAKSSTNFGQPLGKYESVALPDELRGPVADYSEHIYESPIKTSGADVHFGGDGDFPGYFAHTRIEDVGVIGKDGITGNEKWSGKMASGKTNIRRVIEIQSDLMQKGRLEGELAKSPAGGMSADDIEYVNDRPTPLDYEPRPVIEKYKKNKKKRAVDVSRLEPYRNTWWERIVREEYKQAAVDKKKKLQFPVGNTAMQIEGLGYDTNQRIQWGIEHKVPGYASSFRTLKPDMLDEKMVGQTITRGDGTYDQYIITDVLGDGKFKAIPKHYLQDDALTQYVMNTQDAYMDAIKKGYISADGDTDMGELVNKLRKDKDFMDKFKKSQMSSAETFDISGKVDTSNPIYQFYEKDIGKYLTKKYGARRVTDAQGVEWWEVDVDPKAGKMPVEAFGAIGGIEQDDEGNIRFNPEKAALGMLGAGLARKVKNPLEALPKNLIVQHNLTGDKLLHAEKYFGGKLPIPSIAISNKDFPLEGFGDITLIGSKDLIDPKIKGNRVYDADIYSPRTPNISWSVPYGKVDKEFSPAIEKAKSLYGDDVASNVSVSRIASHIEDRGPMDVARFNREARVLYAAEKGFVPKDKKVAYGEIEAYVHKNLSDYESWIENKLDSIGANPRIFRGYTNLGNRRYSDYNLKNVMREMRGEARGKENMMGGPGMLRSVGAKKFRSLGSIIGEQDKLVSGREMDKIKDSFADEYFGFTRKYTDPQYDKRSGENSFSRGDNLISLMIDWEKGMIRRSDFPTYGFELPDEAFTEYMDMVRQLRSSPTEYFEAKPQRAVDIGEFKVAVAPNKTPKKIIDYLKNKGIKVEIFTPNRDDMTGMDKKRIEAIKKAAIASGLTFVFAPFIMDQERNKKD